MRRRAWAGLIAQVAFVASWAAAASWISTFGGRLDDLLSTSGVLALILAGVFLSFATRRTAGWRRRAPPTRWTMLGLFGVTVADAIGGHHGLGGLFERLITLIAAAWIGAVAVGVLRRTRQR